MNYEKNIKNPVVEEKIIKITSPVRKKELIDKCRTSLRKGKFYTIHTQLKLLKLEAQYKDITKYGVIKIQIQEIFGEKRLSIKVVAENNLISKITNKNNAQIIMEEFLKRIKLSYFEI